MLNNIVLNIMTLFLGHLLALLLWDQFTGAPLTVSAALAAPFLEQTAAPFLEQTAFPPVGSGHHRHAWADLLVHGSAVSNNVNPSKMIHWIINIVSFNIKVMVLLTHLHFLDVTSFLTGLTTSLHSVQGWSSHTSWGTSWQTLLDTSSHRSTYSVDATVSATILHSCKAWIDSWKLLLIRVKRTFL